MNVRQTLAASAIAFSTMAWAVPGHAALRKADGPTSAVFHAKGPGGLRIEGKTGDVRVSEASGDVKIVVPLSPIDTGISLRNKHMREKYLEVHKYPNAVLTVKRSALKFPKSGAALEADAQGEMKIHGKTKKVGFHYRAKRSGARYDVSGHVALNINDYGIKVPSYLGVTVKPDITVDVHFVAVDK